MKILAQMYESPHHYRGGDSQPSFTSTLPQQSNFTYDLTHYHQNYLFSPVLKEPGQPASYVFKHYRHQFRYTSNIIFTVSCTCNSRMAHIGERSVDTTNYPWKRLLQAIIGIIGTPINTVTSSICTCCSLTPDAHGHII